MPVASTYLVVTFGCAFLAVLLRLPPLVGFLIAGFLLAALGAPVPTQLDTAANLGVTLLLFGIGMQVNVRSLLRKEIWVTATAHMVIFTLLGAGVLKLLFLVLAQPAVTDWRTALVLGFGLSFSSTVLVVKHLDERSEAASLYGRIAVGVLVFQDLAAVIFIAASEQDLPTPWALLLPALIPLSRVIRLVWDRIGRGEMQALFGVVVALVPGYTLFDAVGITGDLGALVMGMLLAGHPAANELTRNLFTVKELLLVAFFLSIGLNGVPEPMHLIAGLALLIVLVPLQGLGYSLLLRLFKLHRRTTSRGGVVLANFSEFGLIVTAIAATSGWVGQEWLTVMAVAVAASFVVSSTVSGSEALIDRYARLLPRDPPEDRLHPECRPIDLGDAQAVVLGMGRVGRGAAAQLSAVYGMRVVGVEQAPQSKHRRLAGLRVIESDAADAALWDSVSAHPGIRLAILALPSHTTQLQVLDRARSAGFTGSVAAAARYSDEAVQLRQAGASVILEVHSGAGAQLADEARLNLGG